MLCCDLHGLPIGCIFNSGQFLEARISRIPDELMHEVFLPLLFHHCGRLCPAWGSPGLFSQRPLQTPSCQCLGTDTQCMHSKRENSCMRLYLPASPSNMCLDFHFTEETSGYSEDAFKKVISWRRG